MKRLFQIYTIAGSTIIFLSSLLLLQGPVRLANLIVVTPLAALAWINFTNPYKTSENIWTLRMLIVIVCLSGLGLLAFRLPFLLPPAAPASNQAPVIVVSPTPCPQPSFIPADLPNSRPFVDSVSITNPQGAIVFSRPVKQAQTDRRLNFDSRYPYFDFQDGFFELLVDAESTGWVQLDDVIPRLDNIKPDHVE